MKSEQKYKVALEVFSYHREAPNDEVQRALLLPSLTPDHLNQLLG